MLINSNVIDKGLIYYLSEGCSQPDFEREMKLHSLMRIMELRSSCKNNIDMHEKYPYDNFKEILTEQEK